MAAGKQGNIDPDVQPQDRVSTPSSLPVGVSADFVMGVYTQLSQIQRDLGSVLTAQKMLNDQVQSSETRISALIKDSEERITTRLTSTEDKLSSLKDRVNRVFWMGSAVGIVVGLLVGWKPLLAYAVAHIGGK